MAGEEVDARYTRPPLSPSLDHVLDLSAEPSICRNNDLICSAQHAAKVADWAFRCVSRKAKRFFRGAPRNSSGYRGGKERPDFWKKFEIKILVLDVGWPRTSEEQPRSSIIRGRPLISSIHATRLVTQVPSTGSDSLRAKRIIMLFLSNRGGGISRLLAI